MAKGAWGWTSTVLAAVAMFIPGGQWAGLKLLAVAAAATTGYQESKFQQRQAMRAFKKAFGSIGDNALAGSPTYSWDGPQTVSDPSLPVPLCYGEVTVGGNIINAWTQTVNIFATKWDIITPTQIDTPWPDFTNIIRTDSNSRGIRIKVNHYGPSKYSIYYRRTGESGWIFVSRFKTADLIEQNNWVLPFVTIISPDRNLEGKQYDIKIYVDGLAQQAAQGKIHYTEVHSAHENIADINNIAGHKDYQYLTIALAEGEIDWIEESSITLDDNLLTNLDRSYYEFDYVTGHNWQISNPTFNNVITSNTMSYKAEYGDLTPYISETQNLDVQSLILILYFPMGLYQISGNSLLAWTVSFTISYSSDNGATWTPFPKTITAKNNNPFKQSVEIVVPEGSYKVKIVRTSEDPNGTTKIGELWWVSLQEYVAVAQHYPNTAIAYVRLKASEQSSGNVPNFKFKIKGKLVEVPKLTIGGNTVPYYLTYWNGTNYVLDEPWNGNAIGTVCTDASLFVSQWTDNPIWCLRDLINNDYYGLRSYFQSTLNDTDLRLLAKYCDEKVDDGQGGTDKRFKLDIVIDSQDDARNVIERILSTFRGFAVWAENQFKIKINKPESPVQLFTMGNIIGNSLSINYSSASDRFNVAKITYPDRNDAQARMSEVMIYDVPLGGQERAQTFNLIGITRRSQAVRMGRFFLNQAKLIKESVQFKAGLDSIACEAGDVIEFAHDVPGYGLASGRIKASTINSISIDTPISINPINTYKVKVKLTDDTIEERTVHNTNSTPPYTLVMTANFTSTPPVDSHYAFGESGTVTKPYRVLSINRDSIQERQITAIEDNASIYSDTGDAVEPISYSSLKNPLRIPDAVTNLTLKELTVDPGDGSKINTILVSWNPPTLIDDPSILPIVATATTGGSITAGTYYCKYSWIGAGGETMASSVVSIVTTGSTSTITVTIPSFPTDVTSARVYVGTTSGQEKYQGQITASAGSITLTTVPLTGNAIPLTNSTQNDTNYDRAKVYLSDSAGAFWEYKGEGRSNFIVENVDKLTYRIAVVSLSLYGIAQSISDASKVDITIGGDTTLPANVTFIDANYATTNDSTYLTNSPEATIYTTSDNWNYSYGIKLRWNPVADKDLAGYEIRTQDANWGVDNGYLIYRGMNTYFIYENLKAASYTFYVKAYDTSGNYSVTAGSITIGNSAPSLGDIYLDFTGKDCMLWWPECQDEDFKEYQVFVYSDSGRTNLVHYDRIADPIYKFTYEMNIQKFGSNGSRTLYFTIKALDMIGQEDSKNITALNLAPLAPTGLSPTNFMEFVYLSWTQVTDTDLVGYNVYVDTVKVAFVAHPSYGHYGSEGVQYNYYVKAVDSFGEGSQSLTVQGTSQGLNIGPTDINDFAVSASKIFTKIPVLEQDSWTNNSPVSGRISWNDHKLYYNGAKYNIINGYTPNDGASPYLPHKYIYWDGTGILQPDGSYNASYTTSKDNPTNTDFPGGPLTDSQFIIATNVGGAHDLAWNAIANEVIGSAYIQSLAVQDGHIQNLSVGKLTSGTIDAKTITLVRTGASDCFISAGKTDFSQNTVAGFILGIDYADADKVKFEMGNSTDSNYLKWNGSVLDIKGAITITGGSGFANLTDRSADNLLDGTTYKKYAATEQTKLAGVEAGATVGAQTGINLKNDAGSTLTQAAIVTSQGTSSDTSNVNGVAASTVQGGASRANSGLDTSGNVLTKILPASAIGVPGSAGLYLGSDYMGYYNAGWKSVITNTGQFYFGNGTIAAPGTDNYVYWNGTTLAIRGDLTADDITAGGTITGNTVKTAASGKRIELSHTLHELRIYESEGVTSATFGPNTAADPTYLYIVHTANDTPSVSYGINVTSSASLRTTSGRYTYGIEAEAYYVRSNTSGVGVYGTANIASLATNTMAVGGWFNGDNYDLAVGITLSSAAKINGYNGYITIADTNTVPIERRIPSGVSGTVTDAGGITSGTGFTVNRVSAGTYDISFTSAFAAAPIVVVTIGDTGNGTCARRQAITTGGFRVVTFLGSTQSIGDADFSFFAIVP